MCKRNLLKLFLIATLFLVLTTCNTYDEKVIFVDADAPAGGDGTSWEEAYTEIQDAIDSAVPGYEVWVGSGTYIPTAQVGGDGDRKKSILLKNGVELYGGFKGIESKRDERDWKVGVTILSGDLHGDDEGFENNDENCFHVVTGNETDTSAVLDGFTISGGNANFDVWPDDGGGGMNNNLNYIHITGN